MTEISTTEEFVDQYYQMNPETDDVVSSGRFLQPGMVILIENPHTRSSVIKDFRSNRDVERARRWNRWGRVVSSTNTHLDVYVVVQYEDGTKKQLTTGVEDAWIVKKSRKEEPLADWELELLQPTSISTTGRTRIKLGIYVDLDATFGIFHSAESARNRVASILANHIGHYNPTISIDSYDTSQQHDC